MKTKVYIYEACVFGTLLYASDTWTKYKGQEGKRNIFHLRSPFKILNIKWQDRVSDCRVFEMAGITSVTTILRRRRMKWLGYVYWMENTRIPKQCLLGKLSSAQRSQSRQKLRYKDVCKDTKKHLPINPKSWKRMASDRAEWRSTVCTGAALQEEMLRDAREEKRDRRKQKGRQRTPVSNFDTFTCRYRSRPCHSNIGRISHERI